MKKYNISRIMVSIIGVIVITFGIIIYIATERIKHYSVFTPLEDLTFTERIAAELYDSSFKSRDELKKDGLLESKETIKNDNIENLKKANEKKEPIKANYSKGDLETMYINPSKYIGKNLECTGTIMADIGMSEAEKQHIIDIVGKEKLDSINVDAIVIKVKDTDVFVTMMYPKDKINYETWKKGIEINVKGYIKEIKDDNGTSSITLSDNPSTVLSN